MAEIPTFPPRPSRIPRLVSTILIGALSGVAGTILLFWLYPDLRQAKIPPGSQAVIVQQPGTVVVEEGTHLADVRQRAEALVGEVFRSTDVLTINGEKVYPSTKRLGYAVILTSDGLFGTIASVGIQDKDVVVIDGKAYTIARLVRDTASPYVIGKLNDASAFPVTSFTRDSDLRPGMTVLAITSDERASRLSLWSRPEPLDSKTIARSSDVMNEGVSIVERVTLPPGTPIFDLSGSLVGLVDNRPTPAIYLSSTLESLLNHVLAGRGASRPQLGLHYLRVPAPNDPNRSSVVIFDEKPELAVTAKGPAEKAQLKAGDKIQVIGTTNLETTSSSIFAILQEYKPGDSVPVEYQRGSQTLKATIVLGEVK